MAANNGYSGSDLLRMQQDAMQRVREMQRRANEKVRQSTQNVYVTSQNSISSSNLSAGNIAQQKQNTGIINVLERMGIDQEKTILLLLIVLLLNEGADQKLILALCYLLI